MADLNREINEYVAYISPGIDVNAWKQASSKIENILNSALSGVVGKFDKKLKEAREQLDKLQKDQQQAKQKLAQMRGLDLTTKEGKATYEKLGGKEEEQGLLDFIAQNAKQIDSTSKTIKGIETKYAKLATKIGTAANALGIFVKGVTEAYKSAYKFAEATKQISNQFVTAGTIRPDEDVRDIMIRYGVGTQRAQAMSATSDILGLDLEDYSKWTAGARKAFKDLTQYYESELNKIDPSKLEQFNESVQRYQLMTAKFQIQLRTSLIQMMAESDALPELLDALADGMQMITDILSSPMVKTGVEVILTLLRGILDFVNMAGRGITNFGKIVSGGSTNTTTNTTTNNKNINVKISASATDTSQLASQIGLQLQNSLG